MSNVQNYHPGYGIAKQTGSIIEKGEPKSLIALIAAGVIFVGGLAIKTISDMK